MNNEQLENIIKDLDETFTYSITHTSNSGLTIRKMFYFYEPQRINTYSCKSVSIVGANAPLLNQSI